VAAISDRPRLNVTVMRLPGGETVVLCAPGPARRWLGF
jgi:hypothetical protein